MTSRPACSGCSTRQSLISNSFSPICGCARRVAVRHVAADHALDDAGLADRHRARVDGLHRGAVAHHGDGIGDLASLVELVRDQDRGDALALEFQQQFEQRVAVVFVQAGGRLVQDQQLYALGQRLGDLDQLLLADAEIGDQRIGRFLQADLGEQLAGAAEGYRPSRSRRSVAGSWPRKMFSAIDSSGTSASSWWMMMMPSFSLSEMSVKLPRLALIDDVALVAAVRIDPAQHLHQGRFAGAVLAADRVDLAGLDCEIDVAQRLDAGKAFARFPAFPGWRS